MSELREKLVETMDGVLSGKTPLDTAEVVQDLGHTIVMDKFASDREARRIGEQKRDEDIGKATEKIKNR